MKDILVWTDTAVLAGLCGLKCVKAYATFVLMRRMKASMKGAMKEHVGTVSGSSGGGAGSSSSS